MPSTAAVITVLPFLSALIFPVSSTLAIFSLALVQVTVEVVPVITGCNFFPTIKTADFLLIAILVTSTGSGVTVGSALGSVLGSTLGDADGVTVGVGVGSPISVGGVCPLPFSSARAGMAYPVHNPSTKDALTIALTILFLLFCIVFCPFPILRFLFYPYHCIIIENCVKCIPTQNLVLQYLV